MTTTIVIKKRKFTKIKGILNRAVLLEYHASPSIEMTQRGADIRVTCPKSLEVAPNFLNNISTFKQNTIRTALLRLN